MVTEDTGMDESDTEKIELYEQYRRGEISEQEVRVELGDDVIDEMQADVVAFAAAMKRDTSEFLSRDDDAE